MAVFHVSIHWAARAHGTVTIVRACRPPSSDLNLPDQKDIAVPCPDIDGGFFCTPNQPDKRMEALPARSVVGKSKASSALLERACDPRCLTGIGLRGSSSKSTVQHLVPFKTWKWSQNIVQWRQNRSRSVLPRRGPVGHTSESSHCIIMPGTMRAAVAPIHVNVPTQHYLPDLAD